MASTLIEAGGPLPPTPGRVSPVRSRPRWRLHAGVIALFVVLAVVMWWHVWITGHPTQSITCKCGDPSEEIWWLAWLPWAIGHGHDPFFTNALYAGSGGVNELANGSILLPAFILSPVTVLFGPIASFNVGVTLAPVVSAYCMFLFARKLTRFAPAAIAAGLLWGYSPFVVESIPFGHLHDVVGFFLPLAGLVVHDLLVTQRRKPYTNGVLLGVLVVAQFFTGTEPLFVIAVTVPIGIVVGILLVPRTFRDNRRALVLAIGSAVAVAAVVLAYPLWFATHGPRSVSGVIWPSAAPLALSSVVNAGSQVGKSGLFVTHEAGYWGLLGPVYDFLGWGVVLFIVVSAPVWWRRALAWCALVTGVWAWLLAGQVGPWVLVKGLPLAASVQTYRFADVLVLCAAILVAISIDEWHRRGPTLGKIATVGACAAFIPVVLLYPLPFTEHTSPTPHWFETVALRLRPGTRVLAVPFGGAPFAGSMVYQAEDGFRFDLAGGYMLVPGTGGGSDFAHPLVGTTAILVSLSIPSAPQPPITPEALAGVRHSLHDWGIQVSVIPKPHEYPNAVTYLSAVYGRPPLVQHGAAVWYGGGAEGG